ncbi:MAG: cell wall-associated NlpC family hydrolase [Paracoccaceae bacterium]|jgi:cell wall-associated NlpC family hydrolase
MHPRRTPANANVAHISLDGQVKARQFVSGKLRQVSTSFADLRRKPLGALDCQLLFGSVFLVLENADGWAFGQSVKDGYVGYVLLDQLADASPATHQISANSSHVYAQPDMKSGAITPLSFGSSLAISDEAGNFAALNTGGFVPRQHVSPLDQTASDFVTVFERFLGVPYLWGGDTIWGMDCSGALQLALYAAGHDCPRDSDMQQAELGSQLDHDAPLQRGDLIFWSGHIGVMRDTETLIHANAHHMAVASEPLIGAVERIRAKGDGNVTSRRRL